MITPLLRSGGAQRCHHVFHRAGARAFHQHLQRTLLITFAQCLLQSLDQRRLVAEVPRTLTERPARVLTQAAYRSEEHTSELQSLMRNSYAVLCLKKNNYKS